MSKPKPRSIASLWKMLDEARGKKTPKPASGRDFVENELAPASARGVAYSETAAWGLQIGIGFVPGWDN